MYEVLMVLTFTDTYLVTDLTNYLQSIFLFEMKAEMLIYIAHIIYTMTYMHVYIKNYGYNIKPQLKNI